MQQNDVQTDISRSQYQQVAKQLVKISPDLQEIVQDQQKMIGNLTAQNMF